MSYQAFLACGRSWRSIETLRIPAKRELPLESGPRGAPAGPLRIGRPVLLGPWRRPTCERRCSGGSIPDLPENRPKRAGLLVLLSRSGVCPPQDALPCGPGPTHSLSLMKLFSRSGCARLGRSGEMDGSQALSTLRAGAPLTGVHASLSRQSSLLTDGARSLLAAKSTSPCQTVPGAREAFLGVAWAACRPSHHGATR